MDRLEEAVFNQKIKTNQKPQNWQDIVQLVARETSVSEDEILGKDRHLRVAWARHIVMYLAAEVLRMSQNQIGRLLNCTHGNISHCTKHLLDQCDTDRNRRAQVNHLLELCQ